MPLVPTRGRHHSKISMIRTGFCFLSPLAKDEVYSADTALWGISGEGTFAPSAQHVQKCLKEWQENDHLFLMALIEHKDVKKGLFSSIVSIENVFKAEDIDKAVFIGYDVIDIWTGISVL